MAKNQSTNSGQVMMMSVVMLGGILLTATAVAGLLIRNQLRQTGDAVNSAQALFAADAGLEWLSYCAVSNQSAIFSGPTSTITLDCSAVSSLDFINFNSVTATTSYVFQDNASMSTRDGYLFSEGRAGKSVRAVETILPF